MSNNQPDLVLDGRKLTSLSAFFREFRTIPGVPDWMGENLDALNDVLTGELPPLTIEWHHMAISRNRWAEEWEFETLVEILSSNAKWGLTFIAKEGG